MTGTLTIVGAPSRKLEWDTDRPASYEAAKAAYAKAVTGTGQAFDTKAETRIDSPEMPEIEDITVVPRFSGG